MTGPLSIKGRMSLFPTRNEFAPCVWCGDPTAIWMKTPGRPDLGEVPLHAYCSAEVIWAYEEWRDRQRLGQSKPAKLIAFEQRLLTTGTTRG